MIDVGSGRDLPLQLRLEGVAQRAKLLTALVAHAQLLSQIAPEHCLRDVQLDVFLEEHLNVRG